MRANLHNFLWCFPLRHGVFVLSLATIMLSGTGAAGSWIIVKMLEKHPQDVQDQIALFVQAIVLSLLGVLALVGFTAGVTKGRGLLYIYSKMLLVYITLNLGALGWVIYSALRKVDDSVVFNCERSDGDDMLVKQFCEKGFNFVKGLPIAFMTVALFVQIYAFVIALSFYNDLEVDEAASFTSGEDALKSGPRRMYRTKYLNF